MNIAESCAGSDRRDAVRRMVEVLRNVEVVGEVKCSVDYIREVSEVVVSCARFPRDKYVCWYHLCSAEELVRIFTFIRVEVHQNQGKFFIFSYVFLVLLKHWLPLISH